MSKQILLCMETKKKARTDYQYIAETIKRFYKDDRKISYKPIFLESKTRYKDNGKLKEIDKYRKNFPGDTKVIYFIDYDDSDTSSQTLKLFNEIINFCKNNNYEFVFFVKDIEDVYWGKQINNDEKVEWAAKFKRKQLINNVKENNLLSNSIKQHCSNILVILDKYWIRK